MVLRGRGECMLGSGRGIGGKGLGRGRSSGGCSSAKAGGRQ
jgi:hypothetical protein